MVRDHKGCTLRAIPGPLGDFNLGRQRHLLSYSVCMSLRLWERRDCYVEGDCKMVIGWGKGIGNGSWPLAHFIYEIKQLSSLLSVSLAHVLGDQNVLADNLAN